MTEGLPLCELEICFCSGRSENFKGWVTWNKDQKTLTSIGSRTFTREKDGSSERSLCGAPKAFEKYKGKNLRVKVNGKHVTLSVREDVQTYNDKGCFQIAYSEYREGWFTKEVFFEVRNLAGWVYFEGWRGCRPDISKDFGNRSEGLSKWLKHNRKSWVAYASFEEWSLRLINTTDVLPEKFHFEYLNEDFTLTLYDKCIAGCYLPFRVSYERECYFGITSFREHDKDFFETLIRKITYFLSLLFGEKAVTNRIFESNKQQWRWDYNPSEKENSDNGLLSCSISYDTIRDKFGNKLTKWFEACERYETIIDPFFQDEHKRFSNREVLTNRGELKVMTSEEKEIIKETFLKRLNRLETYGNILTKGRNASEDIEAAVSAVDNEAWSDIIHETRFSCTRLTSDEKFQICFYNFGETPEGKKEDFVKIVTAFRNYFVHSFRDGKKKTPFTEGIEKFFTTAQIGSLGNFEEVMDRLSQCFSVFLHFVLLQSKRARESKGRTKPSRNLFPETNHTREDYGKIILKYLQRCLDDKETSETLKGYIAYVKNILLFSREKATRRTSDGENSGTRCIDVVLTENNLKCLSDILTELTWRCEKDIEEAFEKDERQKNIWALRPIYECFMHDFRRNRLDKEQKSLGELIINLKNSFDPDVNSLFCEQFTDYRGAEVDFKMLSSLTDCLSDILHQLLLQEAGLAELLGKERIHE